jgi:transposase-like protein
MFNLWHEKRLSSRLEILQNLYHIKILMADLKRIYAAPTEEIALVELDSFEEKWTAKYPKICIIIGKGQSPKNGFALQ